MAFIGYGYEHTLFNFNCLCEFTVFAHRAAAGARLGSFEISSASNDRSRIDLLYSGRRTCPGSRRADRYAGINVAISAMLTTTTAATPRLKNVPVVCICLKGEIKGKSQRTSALNEP